jgi:NADH-quinone oxidoreductase subunit I
MIETVKVNSAPRNGYFGRLFKGSRSIFKGLSVTIGYFFSKSRIVTEQYPENRSSLKMTRRFRGAIIMPHDAQGEHKCTGCTLCEKACPNSSISVLNTKNIANKKVLGKYIWRADTCTLCGLCVEACPFDAIHIGNGFEAATTDKKALDIVLNLKEGRG